MTERQEQTVKALRRAWREFAEKVNRMGNVTLISEVDEKEQDGKPVVLEFFGRVEVGE